MLIRRAFPNHSLFADPTSPGQADLRNILRAFSHFAPGGYKSPMSLLAGMLLIHCVAEDAFWLLSGLINGVLRDYYAKDAKGNNGMKVDAAVFAGVLQGSEPKVARLFRDVGVHRASPPPSLSPSFSSISTTALSAYEREMVLINSHRIYGDLVPSSVPSLFALADCIAGD